MQSINLYTSLLKIIEIVGLDEIKDTLENYQPASKQQGRDDKKKLLENLKFFSENYSLVKQDKALYTVFTELGGQKAYDSYIDIISFIAGSANNNAISSHVLRTRRETSELYEFYNSVFSLKANLEKFLIPEALQGSKLISEESAAANGFLVLRFWAKEDGSYSPSEVEEVFKSLNQLLNQYCNFYSQLFLEGEKIEAKYCLIESSNPLEFIVQFFLENGEVITDFIVPIFQDYFVNILLEGTSYLFNRKKDSKMKEELRLANEKANKLIAENGALQKERDDLLKLMKVISEKNILPINMDLTSDEINELKQLHTKHITAELPEAKKQLKENNQDENEEGEKE